MQDLLLKITERLATAEGIRHSDENWGQMMYYGTDIPVQWPCGLVDLSGGQFSNNGYDYRNNDLSQQGTISIEITVANIKLSNTSAKAPMSQKTKGFEIYKYVENVHNVLQGWKPLENSGAMVRTGIQSVKRDDGVQEKRIIYTIGLHGC
ncbi:hypothetical protein [Chryseobacterium sp.]|uniref:hypothetical protein n=1 Tax=Chryseobacterium sp. TaxID=1871047 RepID=UPI00289FD08D|nr:hypothetical protein [Chryseobacterium sp.]